MKKVSIAMAYVDRGRQLLATLYSIEMQKYPNLEVVIVDDNSKNPMDGFMPNFKLDIKYIRLKEKVGINPCKAYNEAFNKTTGDIVIIQNPECSHMGDIIKTAAETVNDSNYLSFACYSATGEESYEFQEKFIFEGHTTREKEREALVTKVNLSQAPSADIGGRCGTWFNHSLIRPVNFHFCTAITRNNLINHLGGFDERFLHGSGYDDNELLHRIKLLGLKIVPCDRPFVVHLFHSEISQPHSAIQSNKSLFEEIKLEGKIKVNV